MTDLLNAIQQVAPGGFDAPSIRDRFRDVDIDDNAQHTRLTYKNKNTDNWVACATMEINSSCL